MTLDALPDSCFVELEGLRVLSQERIREALTQARDDALEEAANVLDVYDKHRSQFESHLPKDYALARCAKAIRAMKETK